MRLTTKLSTMPALALCGRELTLGGGPARAQTRRAALRLVTHDLARYFGAGAGGWKMVRADRGTAVTSAADEPASRWTSSSRDRHQPDGSQPRRNRRLDDVIRAPRKREVRVVTFIRMTRPRQGAPAPFVGQLHKIWKVWGARGGDGAMRWRYLAITNSARTFAPRSGYAP